MMKIGAIGCGQAGINLADQFAKHFPAIALDTALQNLNSINNVKDDMKYHVKINEWGGCGKNIQIGEDAFKQHRDKIREHIKTNFKDLDYVWICAGLGGGSGTLGCIQTSYILNQLNIRHGMLVTLPANHEGTDEVSNAVVGLKGIEIARKKFNNLRSIILVENQKLKEYVMENHNASYENLWQKANEYIFNMFYNLYEYSQQESQFSFDGQDYVRLFLKSGYMCFGKKIISDTENKSDNVLANEVRGIWSDNIFVEGLEFDKGKGAAVIVNRPSEYDKDGKIINQLFDEVKSQIGSGTFCFGVYKGKDGILNKVKETINKNHIEVFTMVSGLPFPQQRADELKELSTKEIDSYNDKDTVNDFNVDLKKISNYVNDIEESTEQLEDFSVFDEEDKENKVINWDF